MEPDRFDELKQSVQTGAAGKRSIVNC